MRSLAQCFGAGEVVGAFTGAGISHARHGFSTGESRQTHHRFGWSTVPVALVVLGDLLVAIGFYFIFLVYRENPYTAATVEVAAGQTVVTTGPYAIVRHPMYASGALYMFGTPLALGSYWGFVALGAVAPFLLWRLVDEERILARDLRGYTEYQRRVRHRLLPGIW